MKTVIFACVHNAGRSQMAAAFFNAVADPTKARALSAGTNPGLRVHPEVVSAMREVGIDLEGATPQRLTAELATGAELLVTMGCGDACPVVPGLRRDDWPLRDPKGLPVGEVRAIRDDVRTRVALLVTSEGWRGASTSPRSSTVGRRKEGVLFLCSANSARSQMAEAILRARAPEQFEVHSAGLEHTAEVHPLTLEVLEEAGFKTAGLHSKGIRPFLGKLSVRYAIIVCEKAEEEACPRLYPLALETLRWPFPNPALANGTRAEQFAAFRAVRDALDSRISEWLASLGIPPVPLS